MRPQSGRHPDFYAVYDQLLALVSLTGPQALLLLLLQNGIRLLRAHIVPPVLRQNLLMVLCPDVKGVHV